MDDQPSTSKSTKKASKDEVQIELPPQLDISSDEFNAMQALYANPNVKLTERKSKIIYQNMAAFEIEYNKKGLYGLSLKSTDVNNPPKKNPPKDAEPSINNRRFLPHQLTIKTNIRAKNQRCILKVMENLEGPMAVLRDCMRDRQKIIVYTRSEHGIRGTITGYLISFDKHWNMFLRDVRETWKRRKYKYDENKTCGTPSDCCERLKALGITLPETKVKSLNRKNVELSRSISQLLVRGEQVVLVISKKDSNESGKSKSVDV